MFLVWQFVSDLLVPSVTWWVTWNSDDYRDAGTNEAKYTNGARPDAARDNGAILTLILWSCERVRCFSLTNDANIWPSENIFIELINGSDIMAVICWKLMVSTGRVDQPDIAIIIIFVKWYVHYSGSPSDIIIMISKKFCLTSPICQKLCFPRSLVEGFENYTGHRSYPIHNDLPTENTIRSDFHKSKKYNTEDL